MDIAGGGEGGGDDRTGDALTAGDSELAAMAAAKRAFWGERVYRVTCVVAE